MTKIVFITSLIALSLSLTACGTVEQETFTPIVVDGRTYELRTRTIDGPNGSYQTTSAMVGRIAYLCKIDSPGDCEAAVRRGRDEVEDFR